MRWFLATTETRVRWYSFGPDMVRPDPAQVKVNEVLDLEIVQSFSDKSSASRIATAAGLNVRFRHVRI